MSNTATRLITLLMLLQRQPNQKASDLAEKLGISVRSLHRYIGMLDEMGIPIYSERGPYGGFSLVRGYKMPPLVFTPEEAVAVYLGTSLVREMWGKLYQDAAQGALSKLDNVLPEEQQNEIAWARRTLITTGMHRASLDALIPLLEKIRRAIHEQRRVEMKYRKQNDQGVQAREVEPYALVHRWGWWYVVGYCRLRSAIRSFRIDRIAELTLLDKTFQIPEEFNAQEYLARAFAAESSVMIRLCFSPQGAHVARNLHAMWDTLEEKPDGSVIVTFAMPDLQWAASMVMGFGPIVTALEPEGLRQTVREWANAVVEQYPTGENR
ncbi:MAG: YafY family transcriptional regulator [Chloroflexi bacterium]|nr:YafY family transcriptional regulator [Chloroflexota bacterium]